MNHRLAKVAATAATLSILFAGCASDGTMTDTGKGAAIGTLGGAALDRKSTRLNSSHT